MASAPPLWLILILRWAARLVLWIALAVLVARNLRGDPAGSLVLVSVVAGAGAFLGTSHLFDRHTHHDHESETR